MVYADHAATTALSPAAYAAMEPWLQEKYGNPSTLYSLARDPRRAVAQSREIIAAGINADPSEIFFTSGGTEADNWALKGTMFQYDRGKGMITSAIEHHAILNSCVALERIMTLRVCFNFAVIRPGEQRRFPIPNRRSMSPRSPDSGHSRRSSCLRIAGSLGSLPSGGPLRWIRFIAGRIVHLRTIASAAFLSVISGTVIAFALVIFRLSDEMFRRLAPGDHIVDVLRHLRRQPLPEA